MTETDNNNNLLTYPFPRGFDSPHRRYWESFAHHLRNDPVSLSVLAEMLAEYQQYRDNVKQRERTEYTGGEQ